MKLPGRGSVSSTSLVLVTACTLMSACGGEEFTAASGGAAGSAGSGGAGGGSGSSGDGGASGSAGNAGASGSGGSGGASACDCRDGEYCRGGKCTSCSDFGRFSFAKPELVSALPSGSRYPRIGDGPGTLFYSVDQLLRTPDLTAGPGVVVSPANSPRQIAPLYVENSAGLGYNLLFTQFDSDQLPKIFAATWDGSSVTAPQELQGIVNGGAGDYSPALAGSRLWWVSQRNGDPGLFTYLSGQPNEDALQSDVRNSLGSPCHAVSEDFAPWVTADGEHILFAALPAADNCNPIEGAASDLFVGLLDPNTGELVQAASPLNVNVEGDSAETDPSLSGDLCTLYFASNREGGGYRIYRAERN